MHGVGDGVFQPSLQGKYCQATNSIRSVDFPSHSSSELAEHAPEMVESVCTDGLLVYYQNVRGLRTKIDSFMLNVSDSPYDIIVLTETWLDDRFFSAQLFGDAFTVFRNDRNQINSTKSRGGGVLIAVSTRSSCSIDMYPVSEKLEQIWVKIRSPDKTIVIGVLYLPPNRRSNRADIEEHVISLGSVVANLKFSDVVLQFGDYNQSGLVWSTPVQGFPSINVQESTVTEASSIGWIQFEWYDSDQ